MKREPITVLWDPPTDESEATPEDVERRRDAITNTWLTSIAPGFGWTSAGDLLSKTRSSTAVVITARPTPSDETSHTADSNGRIDLKDSRASRFDPVRERLVSTLEQSPIYSQSKVLDPPKLDTSVHEKAYVVVAMTRFGLQPVRSQAEFEALRRVQLSATELDEPAMLVGLPLFFTPSASPGEGVWMSNSGFAPSADLAIFDLASVSLRPFESTELRG
jgi:hypothetical protein